jgi:hypothetical protein
VVGFAHRFRPTYAEANVGHPYRVVTPVTGLRGEVCGIPHLAKNERDVGHPGFAAGMEPGRSILS